jgi:arsenate reductase (thioredoxin)
MDIIITVCDQAAGEMCPVWPGQPVSAHWGVEDPAAATGTLDEKRAAFMNAFSILQKRSRLLTALRLESLDRLTQERRLAHIAKEA